MAYPDQQRFTIAEAALALDIPEGDIRKLLRKGELKLITDYNAVMIPREDIMRIKLKKHVSKSLVEFNTYGSKPEMTTQRIIDLSDEPFENKNVLVRVYTFDDEKTLILTGDLNRHVSLLSHMTVEKSVDVLQNKIINSLGYIGYDATNFCWIDIMQNDVNNVFMEPDTAYQYIFSGDGAECSLIHVDTVSLRSVDNVVQSVVQTWPCFNQKNKFENEQFLAFVESRKHDMTYYVDRFNLREVDENINILLNYKQNYKQSAPKYADDHLGRFISIAQRAAYELNVMNLESPIYNSHRCLINVASWHIAYKQRPSEQRDFINNHFGFTLRCLSDDLNDHQRLIESGIHIVVEHDELSVSPNKKIETAARKLLGMTSAWRVVNNHHGDLDDLSLNGVLLVECDVDDQWRERIDRALPYNDPVNDNKLLSRRYRALIQSDTFRNRSVVLVDNGTLFIVNDSEDKVIKAR